MKHFFISIYLLVVGGFLFLGIVMLLIGHDFLEERTDRFVGQMAKGTFSLLNERLKGLDQGQMHEELERVSARFGYPVRLVEIESYPWDENDPEEYQALMAGRIVDDDEDGYVIMERLGRSDRMIVVGNPFPHHGIDHTVILMFLCLSFLCLTVPALIWSFLLKRDMGKLERSGELFLAGDHDARASLSGFSPLSGVAVFIDTLARNFQGLLRSQKELTNSVSHEIRTPLSRIQFSLEMLTASGDLTRENARHVLKITRDADEIEQLVDEMLTFARLGGTKPDRCSRSVRDVVPWLEALAGQAQKDNPKIRVCFCRESDPETTRVSFDSALMERALRNLMANAFRYARSRLEIRVGSCPDDKGICIHVDDDGPGVDAAMAHRIFEPFFRADNSRNRRTGGYGLGLAIARRIVERHQGEIHVGPSPLGGARFTILLQ